MAKKELINRKIKFTVFSWLYEDIVKKFLLEISKEKSLIFTRLFYLSLKV